MPVISLKVTHPPLSAADHRSPELVKPLFRGSGDTDYQCGNCGSVIAASMGPTQRVIVDAVSCSACGATQRVIVDAVSCSACGAENEFPARLRP